MKLAILKYNAGNIYSVVHALRRLGVEPVLTNEREEILGADKVLFPGQGEASTTMAALHESGLSAIIPQLRQPVLGICIGMQLMCTRSEESDTQCLGIFPAEVKRFRPTSPEDKIPHMGWNTIGSLRSPLFRGLDEQSYIYYVHSYYVPPTPFTIAETTYCGTPFSAALQRDNFYAVQFHPEKSGAAGERILRNFLEL